MSHFAVAVFFEDGGKSVEELLQPYHEFECDGEDDEFVVDVDKTEEAKEDYKEYGSADQSFLSFVKDWYGIKCVHDLKNVRKNSTHKYGYVLANDANEVVSVIKHTNPNKQWDWWQLGGRFSRLLKKIGATGGSVRVKDMVLERDVKDYEFFKRFWEVNVDGMPLADHESKDNFFNMYKPEYYVDRYKSKETYADCMSAFSTFAVVTPDGKWHEKGDMGWWACSSETPEESLAWDLDYKRRFIDSADPNWSITVVDCHI